MRYVDFDDHYERCDTHGTPKGYWCVDCGEKRGDRRRAGGLSPADQAKADADQVLAEIRRLEAGAEPVETAAEHRARVCNCWGNRERRSLPNEHNGGDWHLFTCPARDIPDEPSAEPEAEPAPESEGPAPTHYEDPYIKKRKRELPYECETWQPYAGQAQRIAAILDDGFRLPWDPYDE